MIDMYDGSIYIHHTISFFVIPILYCFNLTITRSCSTKGLVCFCWAMNIVPKNTFSYNFFCGELVIHRRQYECCTLFKFQTMTFKALSSCSRKTKFSK